MNLVEAIGQLQLSVPHMRRTLFHMSCDNYDPEVSLFLICAWDYLYGNQDGIKAAGFEYVFLKVGAPHEMNLRSRERREAIRTMHAPARRGGGARDPRTGHTAARRPGGQGNAKLLVALNDAFSNYMESGESVRNWLALMAANELKPINRPHDAEARKALSKLAPYWSDADIQRFVGR